MNRIATTDRSVTVFSAVVIILAMALVATKEVEEQSSATLKLIKCGDNVDNEVDKLIQDVRERITGTITLDDRDGTIDLRNGYISGINKLQRVGPVNIDCHGKNATALGIIRVMELQGGYDWKTTVFGRKIAGSASLIADEVDLKVVISQLTGFGNKPQLDQLKVTSVKGVRIELTGIGPRLSSALSKVSSVISNVFKRNVARVFENRLRMVVAKELKNTSFPIE